MKHFRAILVGVMLAGFTFVGAAADDSTPDDPTCIGHPGDSIECEHP